MNRAQTADLLNLIASTDGRKLTQQMPAAWFDILGAYTYEDCRAAVINHFQTSTEWLMPAHIIRHVKHLRKDRLLAVRETVEPNRADTDDPTTYVETRRRLTQLIADGHVTPDAYRHYHSSGQPLTDWMAQKQLGAA